tara:strand:+ start:383 stop:631 length:249 start_codon:yes stop_codon:yes gene_type:complete
MDIFIIKCIAKLRCKKISYHVFAVVQFEYATRDCAGEDLATPWRLRKKLHTKVKDTLDPYIHANLKNRYGAAFGYITGTTKV